MKKTERKALTDARFAEIAKQLQAPDLPLSIRAAQRLRLFLEEERIVKEPGENIPAWRTIPTFPDIYAEGEREALQAGHYIHEQGRVCNISSDWAGVLSEGLLKRRNKAEENLSAGVGDEDFLKAAIISIDAVLAYADRYEMAELSDALRDGAKSFLGALQAMRILHFSLWASNVYHNTVGRFDQYMWPYLKADLDSGKLNREQAQKLLEEFFLSFNRDSDLYTGMQQGDNGQSMMLGGCDKDGNCAVNELTYMCLEASLHNGRIDPKINIRVNKDTPLSLYEKCTQLTKQGLGFPQYSNDDVVIPALLKYGYSLEDARNYTVAACWEFIIPGTALDIPNIGAVCHATVVDKCIREKLTQCDCFEDLLDAVGQELKRHCAALGENLKDLWIEPAPYQSVLMADCVDRGTDISQGGKYNNYGIHGTGFADGVDQLCVVKELVFDKKQLSPEALLTILDNQFMDNKELLHYLRNDAPRIGRDASAEPIAEAVLEAFADALEGLTNERGGIFRAGTGSAMYYVWHARDVAALADGHLAGENFSCNYSPSLLLRKSGPLSVMKGFARKALGRVCNGGPLTLELHDTVFRNDDGIQKVAQLVKTFIALGGHQLQLNAISRETLLAARKEPEKYPNLIVRVWGWSGVFVELDACYQDQILQRTSYQSI